MLGRYPQTGDTLNVWPGQHVQRKHLLFKRPHTASSFLARSVGQEQQLQETIRPLGLVESRVKTITELTQSFLEMQVFDCGLKKGVNKLAGCGPFVVD